MKYLKKIGLPFEEIEKRFLEGVESLDFKVLYTHDMQQILSEHGTRLQGRCKIYEICNAELAKALFTSEMAISLVLPCRIAIYEENGSGYIGLIRPSHLVEMVTTDHAIKTLVKKLENELVAILERRFSESVTDGES